MCRRSLIQWLSATLLVVASGKSVSSLRQVSFLQASGEIHQQRVELQQEEEEEQQEVEQQQQDLVEQRVGGLHRGVVVRHKPLGVRRHEVAVPRHARRRRRESGDARARVLYVVYTDSMFYDTRMKWVVETWGTKLSPDNFVIIGDAPGKVGRFNITGTACLAHSHDEGGCCKWTQGILHVAEMLRKDPSIQYVYFSDDDVYVRPEVLERALAKQPKPGPKGKVFAFLGCACTRCSGICGGGGYAASPEAVLRAVAQGRESFMQRMQAQCKACEEWSDMAVSEVYRDDGAELVQLKGLHPLLHSKEEMHLETEDPITFHYINSETKMRLLHELFTGGSRTQAFTKVPEDKSLCLTFRGNTRCPPTPKDAPWQRVLPTTGPALLQVLGLAGIDAERF